MISGIVFILNIFFAVISLVFFYSVEISPKEFWLAGFMSWICPFLIVLNFLFIVFWLAFRPLRALLSLAILIWGFDFIIRTFSVHPFAEKTTSNIKVLSYNTRIFNVYDHLKNDNYQSSKDMIEWLLNSDADLLLLQEFYDEKKSSTFNVHEKFSAKYPYHHVSYTVKNENDGKFGMAIYSKFAIINKGSILKRGENNQTLFVDILAGKDTLRVYNFHLHSMSINDAELVDNVTKSKDPILGLKHFNTLKDGFAKKAEQLDEICAHIDTCRFATLVACDLNDTPYSYCYETLSERLENSFEEAGMGFGITYNGRIPFLRIDNQFFSTQLNCEKFITYDQITFSDHFPIEGYYSWE